MRGQSLNGTFVARTNFLGEELLKNRNLVPNLVDYKIQQFLNADLDYSCLSASHSFLFGDNNIHTWAIFIKIDIFAQIRLES